MTSRIESDALDREKIRKALENCVDPLNPTEHPDELFNAFLGVISIESVNVHDAVAIGRAQMKDFENGLPAGFNKVIQKELKL